MAMFKNIIPITIVVIFAFIAGFSLLKPGLPPTHDGEYHVIRFYEFDKVLWEGNWYPRWAPDLNYGFGVPLFNYVYPLPNYFASLIHLFGLSFIDAFKLNMFVATIVGAIFFYLWSSYFWGKLGGAVSSVFYTFSPYHLVDIYVRGSIGEVWALALFPAFLWSITRLLKEKKPIFLPISSLFLSLIIFSHNILGLMFFIFAICYSIFIIYQNHNKKDLLFKFSLVLILGLGLSSVFWLPAILEQGYVKGLQVYNVEENFPEVFQLIFPSWGTGFSNSDLQNQMSFQIGITNLFAVMLSFLTLFFLKDRYALAGNIKNQIVNIKNNIKYQKQLILFFLFWFFFIFFLMLRVSLFVWKTIPFMDYFQFPWRFLSLEILAASFLAGSIFSICRSKIIAFVLVFLVVLLSFEYMKPAYYHQRNDNYYTSRSNFIDGTNSVGNYFNTIWFSKNLIKQKEKLETGQGVKILSKKIGLQKYQFILSSKKEEPVIANTAYFPGWTVFINGKKEIISPASDGRITFNLPKGEIKVEVIFLETFIRIFAALISFMAFLIIAVLLVIKRKGDYGK